jgi:predicted dehydrogenase
MSRISTPKIAIIGTGQRAEAFINLISNSSETELVALCDKNIQRLEDFSEKHNCTHVAKYTTLDQMLDGNDFDALIIVVPDFQHANVAEKALLHDKHILLEKPMALTEDECHRIFYAQKSRGKIIQLGFVLREHPMYKKIKEIIDSKKLGQIISINATEDIGVMHGASYMRRWHRKSSNCGSFILAKCSHDLDLLSWFINAYPTRVASFGSNSFFTPEKQKYKYCSQCPDSDCRFRFKGEFVYLSKLESDSPSKYGFDLCVYNSDKDIVDNQVIILEYANGTKATFSLNLFAGEPKRTIQIVAADAYLSGDSSTGEIQIIYSDDRKNEKFSCVAKNNTSGHGGSDQLFFDNFITSIKNESKPCADFYSGLASTIIGNAIEKSRIKQQVVEISPEEYKWS